MSLLCLLEEAALIKAVSDTDMRKTGFWPAVVTGKPGRCYSPYS